MSKRVAKTTLGAGARTVATGGYRIERLLVFLLTPVRKTLTVFRRMFFKAEATVLDASERVSENVAKSALATRAKKLAVGGRKLEFHAIVTLLEAVRRVGSVLGRMVPAPVRRGVAYLTFAFLNVLAVFFVFVWRWFRTRHYWHLLRGIPAFLLALPLSYCMIRMPFYGSAAKAKHYRVAAQSALSDKEYETASLYFRKLQQLGAMNETVEYQVAQNAWESGDKDDAVARMRKLAPDDRVGFSHAHVWLARWYLNGESDAEIEDANKLAERHLRFALERNPTDPDARLTRALLLERTGQVSDALSELQRVVRQIPEQGLSLAKLYADQGQWNNAHREVQNLLELYEDKATKGSELRPLEYLIWSDAQFVSGDLNKAIEILEAGFAENPDDENLRARLFELTVFLADRVRVDQPGETDELLRLLRRAHEIDRTNEDVLIRIANLHQEPGELGKKTRDLIRVLANSDDPPKRLHAIIGAIAAADNDHRAAVVHLQKACSLNPEDARSLNNLAWSMVLVDPTKCDEALALIERAVELNPSQPIYHATRGQILVKLKRWDRAVEDLEFALNGLPSIAEVHDSLAIAYENLGKLELAAAHRRLASAQN